jgi:alkanesulfonate monooxygenase SsuD/methylene tetrahydromethanopterin reductase-like flavin-dependent oxidoreductase (luciferase family)
VSFEFDILFEVQVPRPWTDGKERNRFHEAVEQVVFAEQMGFNIAWFVEHHFLAEWAHSSAPEVVLGALTQRTSTIRLGHGVTLLPGAVNHPIRVAERAAMLDIMSDGRLEMGTGRSSSPYQLEAFGVDVATTREQWQESIRLLPKLWTEEDFSYHGRFYSWDDKVTVVPRPVQKPHPPLWVAATQADTCQMAGEYGIGLLMPALNSPDKLAPQVKVYKDAIANATDPAGMFINDQCALFAVTSCNDDDDFARTVGGSAALWYVDTIKEIYSNDWRGTPLDQVPDSYRAHVAARQSGASGAGNFTAAIPEISDSRQVIDQFIEAGAFLVGDPDRVIDNVRKYRAIGGDRLVCVMQLADLRHDDIMRSIELFGTKVMPAIAADEAADAAAGA